MKQSKWKLTAEQALELEAERPALEAMLLKQATEAFELALRLQEEMAQKALLYGPQWYLM